VIFNKQGTVIKRQKFFFGKSEIEITDQYTYLGFTFVPSGKKNKGIENLTKLGNLGLLCKKC